VEQEDVKARQATERENCLQAILDSPARRKLVIGGPGTGKTYTFRRVLERCPGGNNLAMTFINALVDDMQAELAEYAEVKTFHAYSKKILHQLRGGVELVPYLTRIVERDAEILGRQMADFKTHFQMLDDSSPEVAFYLSRGDYYDVVSFDDSVYRVYKRLRSDPSVVPEFHQILIDEFQDFNALEVAFIGELEKRGPIIIAGDDDQAVYDQRCASPRHLRDKHASGDYEVFPLPFCTRCPEVIVLAAQAIIETAESLGYMQGRIPKTLECYLGAKEADSAKYPNIVVAECSEPSVFANYVATECSAIDPDDIAESHREGAQYPTVLVVGQGHYLGRAVEELKKVYPQLDYRRADPATYGLSDGYKQLMRDPDSNLGWRIVLECCRPQAEVKRAVTESEKGASLIESLDPECVKMHLRAVQLLHSVQAGDALSLEAQQELQSILGAACQDIVQQFTPVEEPKQQVDTSRPSVRLTSFEGCKGLSAGHVFILGAHNEAIPKNPKVIEDIEISQFIVALTRARKRCHIVSNRWGLFPKGGNAKSRRRFEKSVFTSWIPRHLIDDRGYLKKANLK
jgi:superfamily I DNA/RNA helicase